VDGGTAQVARAAGIGQATIFRAFADKDALLDAAVAEVLRPDHVVLELASISLDQPLAGRLTEAAEALCAHLGRTVAGLGALRASGHRGPLPDPATSPAPGPPARPRARRAGAAGRADPFAATRGVVAELFEPDAAALRLPPDPLAELFLRLQLTRGLGWRAALPSPPCPSWWRSSSTARSSPEAIDDHDLDHAVIAANANVRSARRFAELMGTTYDGFQGIDGRFAAVRANARPSPRTAGPITR
jgi:AcrR family transcriptional regulator